MDSLDIISLIVTILGVVSFSAIFTILYVTYSNSTIREIKIGNKDIELIDEVIYERQTKIRRRKKFWKILRTILFYIMLVVIVPLFIFSVYNRITGNATMLGKNGIVVVASGSMSEKHANNKYLFDNKLDNQFNTYDIIVVEKVEHAKDLNVHDVIAYRNEDGINIIHRIIEIKRDSKGYSFVTQGDANKDKDEYEPRFEDVVGRYVDKKIDGLGVFVLFLQSYAGIITIVSIVYCMIMIDKLSEKINRVQENRIKQLEEVIDYSEENNTSLFKHKMTGVIYYKGFAYIFDENGFIEKNEIEDSKHLERSNDTIIKEVVDGKTSEMKVEEIKIEDTQGD